MTKTRWELMLTGQSDKALRLMRDAYDGRSGASETIDLGVAYLWLGDYAAAWEHFNAANERRPGYMDIYYQMAGAAKWCLNARNEAVEQWIAGCDCDTTDFARGISSPLLIFAASLIAPETFARSEAEKLLAVRANEKWVRNWPGPIAEYALARIDEAGLRHKCVGINALDTAHRNWCADFYVGVLEKAAGNVSAFIEAMRRLTSTSPKYLGPGKNVIDLSDKVRHAEFFLARTELTGLSRNQV